MGTYPFLFFPSFINASLPIMNTAGRRKTILNSRAGRWRTTYISPLTSRYSEAAVTSIYSLCMHSIHLKIKELLSHTNPVIISM